jgi:hypothetical protein
LSLTEAKKASEVVSAPALASLSNDRGLKAELVGEEVVVNGANCRQ